MPGTALTGDSRPRRLLAVAEEWVALRWRLGPQSDTARGEGNLRRDANQRTWERVSEPRLLPWRRPSPWERWGLCFCSFALAVAISRQSSQGCAPSEGLLNGHRHAAGLLRVVVEHFYPRHGLQHGPVAARNREESERRETRPSLRSTRQRIGALLPQARFMFWRTPPAEG